MAGALDLAPADLSPYRAGSHGLPYVLRFDSGKPGPNAVIAALIHGNELCGAIALDRLVRAGVKPAHGSLTLAFCNVAAYARFDPRAPAASRFVEEDMNRIWDKATLDGPRKSVELDRARALRPVFDAADCLLDLHSMLEGDAPLILAGMTPKSLDLARKLGAPGLIVRDRGHRAGSRLRDYGGFAEPASPKTALLVECGQHWARPSAEVAYEACQRFLAANGLTEDAFAPTPQRVIEVTEAVIVTNGDFRFLGTWRGFEVIAKAGTPIARESGREIKTPYDDCVLVMPSPRLVPGQTAVRLGRYV
jgi:predicted deacylase